MLFFCTWAVENRACCKLCVFSAIIIWILHSGYMCNVSNQSSCCMRSSPPLIFDTTVAWEWKLMSSMVTRLKKKTKKKCCDVAEWTLYFFLNFLRLQSVVIHVWAGAICGLYLGNCDACRYLKHRSIISQSECESHNKTTKMHV